MTGSDSWGIVSTIKAPVRDILTFAAWHLDQGAAHLFLYLDDDNQDALARLASHPNITAVITDDAYWQNLLGRTPVKHQLRQCRNAEHAHGCADGLDWLAHIDVDEFLMPTAPVGEILASQPSHVLSARVRPEEVLCQEGQPESGEILCKSWLPPARRSVVPKLYPTWGRHFRGGFLSHVAGKVFARTGQQNIGFRIHDIFQDKERVPSTDLTGITLLHDHASRWSDWLESYRYRHANGSYRSELKGALSADQDGLTPHEVLQLIEARDGKAGLRAFFEEMCLATPDFCRRLDMQGALSRYKFDFDTPRDKHFPDLSA